MACPHGNGPAKSCSQCLGAEVRKVRQVVDGVFMVGEQVVDRNGALHQPQSADYGTVVTTSKAPRCSYCRKAGHSTEKCRDRLANEATAAQLLGLTQTPKAG